MATKAELAAEVSAIRVYDVRHVNDLATVWASDDKGFHLPSPAVTCQCAKGGVQLDLFGLALVHDRVALISPHDHFLNGLQFLARFKQCRLCHRHLRGVNRPHPCEGRQPVDLITIDIKPDQHCHCLFDLANHGFRRFAALGTVDGGFDDFTGFFAIS